MKLLIVLYTFYTQLYISSRRFRFLTLYFLYKNSEQDCWHECNDSIISKIGLEIDAYFYHIYYFILMTKLFIL